MVNLQGLVTMGHPFGCSVDFEQSICVINPTHQGLSLPCSEMCFALKFPSSVPPLSLPFSDPEPPARDSPRAL